MILKELKEAFENLDDDTILDWGLTDVFSWRGVYAEVAFSVGKNVSAKQCKELIRQAYEDEFYGYKGGEYRYSDYTQVHFERDESAYTNGEYSDLMISEIENREPIFDRDVYLVNLMVAK